MATIAEQILDRAIQLGNEKSAAADTAAEAATVAAMGFSVLDAPTLDAAPTVAEPSVLIPSTAAGVDSALYNSTYDRIMTDLSDKFAQFFIEYFPLNDDLMHEVEAWLSAAIQGGTGVNATVEEQIWQRDRDRITRTAVAAEDEALSSWAAMGFPLPSGQAVAAVEKVRRERDLQIAESSRARAIKAWEMEYENVKFAVSQAIDYRVKAINSAGEYIRALALAPQVASGMATAAASAQANLINAATGFFGARIRAAELVQDTKKTRAGMQLQAGVQNLQGFNNRIQVQASTAAAVAQSLGAQAASALNAVNATSQVIQTLEG